MHSDIYEADFWQDLQGQIRNGVVVDVFPYRQGQRFDRGKNHRLRYFLAKAFLDNDSQFKYSPLGIRQKASAYPSESQFLQVLFLLTPNLRL